MMYAPDQVHIELEADTWTPGVWTVEAAGDACTVTLPGGEPDCAMDPLGLNLTADGAGLESLTLWEMAPETVELALYLDDVEVLATEVTPTYTVEEPNGEGCGETRYGTATVTMP